VKGSEPVSGKNWVRQEMMTRRKFSVAFRIASSRASMASQASGSSSRASRSSTVLALS
jgi:hypothetical protein